MASSLRYLNLFFVVATVATLTILASADEGILPPGHGIMSIHNDFASKLYVQCDSDREYQAVDMVWAQEAHRFTFNPDMDKYWICTIKTTPMTEYPYTPVPLVWGKFAMYVRDPPFRACYPVCVWKADADGLALIIHAGDKATHIYSWQKQ